MAPDQERGDPKFSAVIQYYCRRSSCVTEKKNCPGDLVQLFVKKDRARHRVGLVGHMEGSAQP